MVAAFYMKKCSVFQYLKFRFLILNLHGRPATKPPVPSFAAQRFSGGVSPEAGVPSTIDRIEIQAGGGYASGEVGWNDSRVLLLSLGRSSCTNCSRRGEDRKSTRLNSSHVSISYAVF